MENHSLFQEVTCNLCGLDKRIATLEAELAKVKATLPCGHPASMLLKSAETGEPLYCEYCDCIQRRNDAEKREVELQAERDAAVQDAERYRWLRQQSVESAENRNILANANLPPETADDYDRAIDAARKEGV